MNINRFTPIAAIVVVWLFMYTSAFVCARSSDDDIEFEYSLSNDGYVSAAIYDSTGRQIRTLLYAKYQPAGKHQLSWDGLNKQGRAQSPKEAYTWKILSTPGFNMEKLPHADFLAGQFHPSSSAMQNEQKAAPVSTHLNKNSYLTIDPSRPDIAVLFPGGNRCFLLKVDISNNEWEVHEMYEEPDTGRLFPSLEPRQSLWQLLHSNDKIFLVSPGGDRRRATPAVYRVDREQKKLIPVARAGIVSDQNEAAKLTNAPNFADDFDEPTNAEGESLRAYSWSDFNNNGKIDNEEFSYAPLGTLISSGYATIDEDWNVYFAPEHQEDEKSLTAWCRLPNRAEAGSDVPRWEWNELQMSQTELPARVKKLRNFRTKSLFRAPDGGVYAFLAGHRGPTDDRQGINWPATLNGSVRLFHWDKDGQLKWVAGNAGDQNEFTRGAFQDPGRIIGQIRGNLLVEDRGNRSSTLWTEDGLHAGSFSSAVQGSELPATSDSSAKTEIAAFTPEDHEYINEQAWELPNGDVIWQPSGDKGIELYKVSGWRNWQRSSGTLMLPKKPQAAAMTGDGLNAEYFAGEFCTGTVVYTRRDPVIWFGSKAMPGVETPPREWPTPPPPALFSKPFSVRWSGILQGKYDEEFRLIVELDEGASVRISINDKAVIDNWQLGRRAEDTDLGQVEIVEDGFNTKRLFSETIQLQAGKKYRIELEYSSSGKNSHMHLNWESSISQERQHIPQAFLYTGQKHPILPAAPQQIEDPVVPPSKW